MIGRVFGKRFYGIKELGQPPQSADAYGGLRDKRIFGAIPNNKLPVTANAAESMNQTIVSELYTRI